MGLIGETKFSSNNISPEGFLTSNLNDSEPWEPEEISGSLFSTVLGNVKENIATEGKIQDNKISASNFQLFSSTQVKHFS